jgi:hypothetical protein
MNAAAFIAHQQLFSVRLSTSQALPFAVNNKARLFFALKWLALCESI